MQRLVSSLIYFIHVASKRVSNISLFYLGLICIGLLYSFYISSGAIFQSDWAAYYLLFDELMRGNFGVYLMPPTPLLFQVMFYMIPIYLIFGISYKTFFLVIFFQTFVNVFALGVLVKKIFTFKKSQISNYLLLLIIISTLLGPLIYLIDAAMFRKDIPLILLAIYSLYEEIIYPKGEKIRIGTKTLICLTLLLLQAFGDPFITYMILIPLALVNFIFFLLSNRAKFSILRISVYSLMCIFLSSLLRMFFSKYIAVMYDESSMFVTLDKLGSNIGIFFNDINALIPFRNFFGRQMLSMISFSSALNILVITLFLFGIIFILYKSIRNNNPFHFFLCSLPIFSCVIYVFSARPVAGGETIRYHILLVVTMYLVIYQFLAVALTSYNRLKVILYLLMIVHLLINTHSFLNTLKDELKRFNEYNRLDANITLIDLLNKKSLKKGFAGYWDSSNNTYYSRNTIVIRSILCDWGKVIPYYWFSYKKWYEPDANIQKTFVYVDKSKQSNTSSCDIVEMRDQFGLENEAIEFEKNKFLYIWNYDISVNIPKKNILEIK